MVDKSIDQFLGQHPVLEIGFFGKNGIRFFEGVIFRLWDMNYIYHGGGLI